MNIQAYIKSGVIESYVMGIADPADVAELQRLSLQYPEIAAAIQECELWLESTSRAEGEGIPLSGDVRQRVLSDLSGEFKAPAQQRNGGFSRYLAAASLILLVSSLGLNLYLYQRYQKATNDYSALLHERSTMLADNKAYKTKLTSMNRYMLLMSDPAVIKIAMPGVAGREASHATLYWNKANNSVYLIANDLPAAPAGKQYQLWALVDGKPVDAGVLQDCEGLCQLKPVAKAQAFAITLEKTGGSPTPSLDQMFVMGKVAS
ncbi:anti-sigma factor [Chitinophaga lutea]